ncbi:MAG: hypothetical protein ACRYGF_12450 [Janthinobacterium lividum]
MKSVNVDGASDVVAVVLNKLLQWQVEEVGCLARKLNFEKSG